MSYDVTHLSAQARGAAIDDLPSPSQARAPQLSAATPIPSSTAPGKIIDVVCPQFITTNVKQVVMLVTVIATTEFVVVWLALKALVFLWTWLALVPLLFAGVWFTVLSPRRAGSRIGRELGSEATTDSLPTLTAELVKRTRGYGGRTGLRAFLKTLAGRGLTQDAIRIFKPNKKDQQGAALEPLDFPFEPQPLNEADSSMIRSLYGADAGAGASGGTALRIRRNILVKGGWALLTLFGVQFAFAVFTAIVKRNPFELGMYTWGVALLVLLFVPVGTRLWGTMQWLVVPGGVLLRRATHGSSGWKLRLFERNKCVLAVAAIRKGRFYAVVADDAGTEHLLVTRAEAAFLLRAWISAIPTPPIEMLRELG